MLKKLKSYQFLFEELVKRDFKKKYKRTILGIGWSVLNPMLTLLVMWLVFVNFFGRDMEHFTTYMFCGNLVFHFFSDSTREGMQSLMGNAHIFTKVNVPKYLFLLSKNVQVLINFAITIVILFVFALLDGVTFTWRLIFLLYPILCQTLFNVGIGMILSALFVFFRDIQYLWSVAVRLIMYLSAIFYTADRLGPVLQQALYLNPVYVFITYFRITILDMTIPPLWMHGLILLYTVLALGIGSLIYKKCNTKFLYYV